MLKATSAIAGAKLATILISILRTKILAELLGPAGMGLVNLVLSSVELARVFFAFGLDCATVRKVAAASTDDDPALLDEAYRIAARTALFIGVAACAALAIASPFLSTKFLGTPDHFWWFLLAAGSLVFTPLLGVELAFLQGLKRSWDLAVCQIIASIFGALLTVAMVAALGKIGAIAALSPVAVGSLLIHHHFLKRYRPKIETPRQFNQLVESRKLLKLGSGFAINGIWLVASGWLNLVFIQSYYGHDQGVLQAGLYGAATTLANFYVGILISSMATEFFPSLIHAANDRPVMNRLLNQQTLLAICIGVPVSLVLLISSPWIMSILYTREFSAGSGLMRWLLAGMAIRFAACPLGYTLLALGSPRLIALSELAMGAVMIGTSYVMLQLFGLNGLGMALVLTNSLYLAGILGVMKRFGVGWQANTAFFVAETFAVIGCCLAASLLMPSFHGMLVCAGITGCYLVHLAVLIRRKSGIGFAQFIAKFRKLTQRKHV